MAAPTPSASTPPPFLPDALASLVISTYLSLPKSHHPSVRSNGVREWTPLAGIALSRPSSSSSSLLPPELLLISLGAGSKVLPVTKKSRCGDVVNDLHAEVLAARGARRWFVEEVRRCKHGAGGGWLVRREGEGQKWRLGEGVEVVMYVSTLPCGDASTVHLAKLQEAHDPEMAALKSASSDTSFTVGELARGRDGYLNVGACRTKPGRADSPPTTSMSCSDKIASWSLLGIQGALLATLLEPIYLSHLVVGEIKGCVDLLGGEDWEDVVRAEVDRAVGGRVVDGVRNAILPRSYSPRPPSIHLTSLPFPFSKLHLSATHIDASFTATTTAISHVASLKPERINQTGISLAGSALKRDPLGHQPLHEKARSRLCKLEMMKLVVDTRAGGDKEGTSYHQLKQSATDYQTAKRALRGEKASVFRAWVGAGEEWERFDHEGRIPAGSTSTNDEP